MSPWALPLCTSFKLSGSLNVCPPWFQDFKLFTQWLFYIYAPWSHPCCLFYSASFPPSLYLPVPYCLSLYPPSIPNLPPLPSLFLLSIPPLWPPIRERSPARFIAAESSILSVFWNNKLLLQHFVFIALKMLLTLMSGLNTSWKQGFSAELCISSL